MPDQVRHDGFGTFYEAIMFGSFLMGYLISLGIIICPYSFSIFTIIQPSFPDADQQLFQILWYCWSPMSCPVIWPNLL